MALIRVNNKTIQNVTTLPTGVTELGSIALSASDLPSGSVLQVVHGVKTDASSSSTTQHVASGLEATITTQHTNSKIFVICSSRCQVNGGSTSRGNWVTIRSSIDDYVSTLTGGVMIGNWSNYDQNADSLTTLHNHQQSIGTAITYKLYFGDIRFGATCYINDVWGYPSAQATLSLMEIAG